MERKIGEIFEYKGEWYQCVNTGFSCADCDIKDNCSDMAIGYCSSGLRTDRKKVVFKKLEKVGEPVIILGKVVQLIKTEYQSCISCAFFNGENCGFTTHPRKCGRFIFPAC